MPLALRAVLNFMIPLDNGMIGLSVMGLAWVWVYTFVILMSYEWHSVPILLLKLGADIEIWEMRRGEICSG